jgi:hypothetical protein
VLATWVSTTLREAAASRESAALAGTPYAEVPLVGTPYTEVALAGTRCTYKYDEVALVGTVYAKVAIAGTPYAEVALTSIPYAKVALASTPYTEVALYKRVAYNFTLPNADPRSIQALAKNARWRRKRNKFIAQVKPTHNPFAHGRKRQREDDAESEEHQEPNPSEPMASGPTANTPLSKNVGPGNAPIVIVV